MLYTPSLRRRKSAVARRQRDPWDLGSHGWEAWRLEAVGMTKAFPGWYKYIQKLVQMRSTIWLFNSSPWKIPMLLIGKLFYRLNNLNASANSACFLSHKHKVVKGENNVHRCETYQKHPPPPRSVHGGRKGVVRQR